MDNPKYALIRRKQVVAVGPTEASVEGHKLHPGERVLPLEFSPVPVGHEADHSKPPAYHISKGKVIGSPVTRKLTPEAVNSRRDSERRRKYPPVGDQLDAIWKVLAAMGERVGGLRPPEAQAMLDRVQAVKKETP